MTKKNRKIDIIKIMEAFDDLEDEVTQALIDDGINPNPSKPEVPEGLRGVLYLENNEPRYTDITKASSLQVGMLMDFFVDQTSYVNALKSRYDRTVLLTKKRMTYLQAGLTAFLKDQGVATTNLKNEVLVYQLEGQDTPVMVQADLKVCSAVMKQSAAEAIVKTTEKVNKAISREQTRRGNEFQAAMRAETSQSSYKKSTKYKNSGEDARWSR